LKSNRSVADGGRRFAALARRLPPQLDGTLVSLRPLRRSDAPRLLAALINPEVVRYIAPPPVAGDGFEQFITWSRKAGRARKHLIYAVVPHGATEPVGLMQLWKVEADFSVAECGFVLAEDRWGSGAFVDGATLLLRYAFETLGVHRLEARVAAGNERGNKAMAKIGLHQEGCLRSCFRLGGTFTDHYMWSALADEWRARMVA